MALISMRSLRAYRNVGFGVMTIMLIAVTIIAILTYIHRDTQESNHIFMFAIENHLIIMIGMVIISVAFGFLWSSLSYTEIEKRTKDTQKMYEVMKTFLNNDERNILDHLIKNNGTTVQAEIARLPHMDRVKAFRSLQRMQQKGILIIEPHGKARYIKLQQHIIDVMKEE